MTRILQWLLTVLAVVAVDARVWAYDVFSSSLSYELGFYGCELSIIFLFYIYEFSHIFFICELVGLKILFATSSAFRSKGDMPRSIS